MELARRELGDDATLTAVQDRCRAIVATGTDMRDGLQHCFTVIHDMLQRTADRSGFDSAALTAIKEYDRAANLGSASRPGLWLQTPLKQRLAQFKTDHATAARPRKRTKLVRRALDPAGIQ